MKTDSHLHIYDLLQLWTPEPINWDGVKRVTSMHNQKEWEHYQKHLQHSNQIKASFGLHPQLPVWEEKELLEKLVRQKSIVAIGECGFDFFLNHSPELDKQQTEIFQFQLELALDSGLPLVLHLRRATDKIFTYLKDLKNVSSVIFHSWPAPPHEAQSLLKRGVNAYFSLGPPLLQGNKKAQGCALQLPLDRILSETDAPYQTLKGEAFTTPEHLEQVLQIWSKLRGIEKKELELNIEKNFFMVYGF